MFITVISKSGIEYTINTTNIKNVTKNHAGRGAYINFICGEQIETKTTFEEINKALNSIQTNNPTMDDLWESLGQLISKK